MVWLLKFICFSYLCFCLSSPPSWHKAIPSPSLRHTATASSLAFLCSFFPLQSILHPAAGVVFKNTHPSMVLPCCDPSHSFPRQLGRTDQGCGSSSWCQPCSFHLWHTGLSAPHMCPVCSCLRVFMLCAWEALL